MESMFQNAIAFAREISDLEGFAANTPQSGIFLGAFQFHANFECKDETILSSCRQRMSKTLLSDVTFIVAVTACLAEAPVSGECQTYGKSTTNFDVMSNWDTSLVTNMSSAFENKANFNGDISRWDTSNVIFMDKLFLNASAFNKPLAFWKTGKVLTMERMFEGASAFDRDVTFLDSSSVTNMDGMFTNANSFLAKFKCESLVNGPPSSCICSREFDCCVGKVCELELDDTNLMNSVSECLLEDPIYGLCERFGEGRKLGTMPNWDVSRVTDMQSVFAMREYFNGDISAWNVSSVTSMNQMFKYARSFNRDISAWDTSKVTDMERMFLGAMKFDRYILTWTGAAATTAQSGIFSEASAFQSRFNCSNVEELGAHVEWNGPIASCDCL